MNKKNPQKQTSLFLRKLREKIKKATTPFKGCFGSVSQRTSYDGEEKERLSDREESEKQQQPDGFFGNLREKARTASEPFKGTLGTRHPY